MSEKVEPIGRPYFRSQVLRLSPTTFFNTLLDEGVKELIDCLIRVSDGDGDRARRIIDRALKTPNCPAPADLEAIAESLGSENVPRGCELCEGTGMRYTRKLVNRTALDADGNPYVYDSYTADCQERCSCELGRFLKAREKEAAAVSHG
jgi:hypothetical protein